MAEEFEDEERVTARFPGPGGADLQIDVPAADGRQEGRGLLAVEALDAEVLVARLAGPGGEGVGEGMGPVEVDVAVRADEQEPFRRSQACEMPEQGDGAALGPVEIVEQHHERSPAGAGDQEPADAVDEAVPFLLRRHRHRRSVGERPAHGGDHLGHDAGGVAEVAAQLGGIEEAGMGVERLDEGPVGRRPFALVATAPQDGETFPLRPGGDLVGQTGLPDALLPGEHHQPAPLVGRLLETLDETGRLDLAADELRRRRDRSATRLDPQLDDGGRARPVAIGTHGGEGEAGPTGEERGHDAGAQHLPGRGQAAEVPDH